MLLIISGQHRLSTGLTFKTRMNRGQFITFTSTDCLLGKGEVFLKFSGFSLGGEDNIPSLALLKLLQKLPSKSNLNDTFSLPASTYRAPPPCPALVRPAGSGMDV